MKNLLLFSFLLLVNLPSVLHADGDTTIYIRHAVCMSFDDVVMVKLYDDDDEPFATGEPRECVINNQGDALYTLLNNGHVIKETRPNAKVFVYRDGHSVLMLPDGRGKWLIHYNKP